MSEEEVIAELQSTWQEKINNREEWKIHKKIIIKLPDRSDNSQGKLGSKYFTAICTLAFQLDLENKYYFDVVLDLINSLLLLRKTEAIIGSLLQVKEKTKTFLSLVSKITPQSVFFLSVFRTFRLSEIAEIYPVLQKETSEYISLQLPFKCRSHLEVSKLCEVLTYFSLSDAALLALSKAWASPSFLVHSLPQNQSTL